MARISERISEALQVRNMSQAELSEATGIGKSSISMYLSDKYEPKRRNLEKMASALKVNPTWLGGDDAPMEAHDVEALMFAQRLLNAMETQGRSPADLAKLLGVKEAQITRWLSGIDVGYIPADSIGSLSDDLDVSPSYLLGWTDDPVYYEKLPIVVPAWFDGSKKSYLRHLEIIEELENKLSQNQWYSGLIDAYSNADASTQKAACAVLSIPLVIPDAPPTPKTCSMIRYEYPAAAGLPLYAESDYERIEVPEDEVPCGADFGIRISGDSMEPTIADGSTVWVHKQQNIRDGEIGILMLGDSAVCKRVRLDCNERLAQLISDNIKYAPIEGDDLEDARVVGRVLGIE